MIIKESEYQKLINAEEILNKKYEQVLKDKNAELSAARLAIEELRESLKPDEIEINIYARECDNRGYWKWYKNVQLEKSKLQLSSGVRNQIIHIFKRSIDNLNKIYEEAAHNYSVDFGELNQKRSKLKSRFDLLPRFTSRKTILKIYKDVYGE